MSNLAKALAARPGQKTLLPAAFQRVTSITRKARSLDELYATEHILGAAFEVKTVLADELRRDAGAVEHMERSMRRAIIEGVFGEFAEPLRDIELALYNYDYNAALHAMRALRTQMFGDSE